MDLRISNSPVSPPTPLQLGAELATGPVSDQDHDGDEREQCRDVSHGTVRPRHRARPSASIAIEHRGAFCHPVVSRSSGGLLHRAGRHSMSVSRSINGRHSCGAHRGCPRSSVLRDLEALVAEFDLDA